ncbi:uncharacterized protein LOC135129111 [Zophobas morio]|uniref:uncharacterized protein LOC135129111 n=1 Tax=Zophobas morio TaxID=2755281 RepID=UPI003082CA4B
MSGIILEGPPDKNFIPEKSMGVIFYEGIKKWDSNRISITDTDNVQITYGKLLQLSVLLAKQLKNFGIKKNDVITIISHNHWKYLVTTLAGFYVGATVNPLNYDYTSGELKHFLSISKPVLVFCTSKTIGNILPLKEESFYPTKLINYDKKTLYEATNFNDFLENVDENESFTPIEVSPKEDVALILTSSGTTGLPKCVQLTHFNFRTTMICSGDPDFLGLNDTDNTIGFLPFFHIFGNAVGLASILYGTKFLILNKFNPERFLNSIQQHKVTKLVIVPPIILFLAKSPLVQKYDLSSVDDVISGAAPLTKELEELAERTLKVKSIRQVYGMTEISGAVTMKPKYVKKYGTSGKATPTHRIKIVDVKTEELLPPHEVGELRFKGDGVMKGYLGNATETEDAFDTEGFLKSGDLGYYDEEGYVYIVDRLKEIIKYKGFQVPPAELENLLLQHSGVKDAGVIGKPDERAGEVPIAFIVKQPNQNVSEEELINYIAENMSAQKHLYGGVRFVEEIPKSTSGKILRRKLKELL